MDTGLFFPDGEVNPKRHMDVYDLAPDAVETCARCPVMQECREEAVYLGEQGVWGGTGTAQRTVIRKALGLMDDNGEQEAEHER